MGLRTAAGGSRTATRRWSPRWANGWPRGDRAFLFGRRTYEQLLTSWNARGGPFKDALNNTRKYVASSNPETRLEWPNSTLLHGDVPAAVAELKESSATNLVIMGSGVLIGSLMAADLIDEYLLMIAPLVLGTGRRLFPGGAQASLRLVESITTSTGVLIATYERHGTSQMSPSGGRADVQRWPEGVAHEASMKQYLLSIYQPDGDLPAAEVLEKIAREVQAVQRGDARRRRLGVLGWAARCEHRDGAQPAQRQRY